MEKLYILIGQIIENAQYVEWNLALMLRCHTILKEFEDCGYDNAEKQFSYVYTKRKLHFKFIFKIFTSFTKKTIGLDLKKVDTIQKLKKSKIN